VNLVKHIAAFTNMLGAENAHVVFPFASIDWSTEEERNGFLNELLVLNNNKKIGK